MKFAGYPEKKSLWPASLSAHLMWRESNGGERDHRQCSSIDSIYTVYIASYMLDYSLLVFYCGLKGRQARKTMNKTRPNRTFAYCRQFAYCHVGICHLPIQLAPLWAPCRECFKETFRKEGRKSKGTVCRRETVDACSAHDAYASLNGQ